MESESETEESLSTSKEAAQSRSGDREDMGVVSVDVDTPSRHQHDPWEVSVDHQAQAARASHEAVASAAAAASEADSVEEEAAEASTVVVDSIVAEAVSAEAMAAAVEAIEVGTAAAIAESATVVGSQKVRLPDHAVAEADLVKEEVEAAAADMEVATTVIRHETTAALHAKEAEDTEIATASAKATASDHTRAATTNHDKEEDTENRPWFVAWWYTPFHFATRIITLSLRSTTTVSVSCKPSRDVRQA